jgi:lysophospholipase L1-like esterase
MYEYPGNPTGVNTRIFNPEKGSLVIDTATPAILQKTTDAGDNSGYQQVGSSVVAATAVFEGDSITNGYGLSSASTEKVSARYAALAQSANDTVYNTAVDGSGVIATPTLASRYAASVAIHAPASGGIAYLFVLVGINDLSAGSTASAIFTALESYATTAIADGFRVIVATVPGATVIGETAEAHRLSLNDKIQQSQLFWAVVPLAEYINDTSDSTRFSDSTHLTALSHKVWARLCAAAKSGATWSPAPALATPQVGMVRLSADFTPAGTSFETIPFDTVVFDPSGMFNTASSKWFPQNAGYYEVEINAQINGASAKEIELLPYNGTTYGITRRATVPNNDTLNARFIFKCNGSSIGTAGAYILAWIRSVTSTGPVVVATEGRTWMTCKKLSGL